MAKSGHPWISRPWIDLLVGCGGWSLPLLIVAYTVVDRDIPRWSAVFYALALICNYPHYMATIVRAYGRDDRGAHRLYTHYLTAGLVGLGLAAHVTPALLPWLFTAYVMWSPWHYSGQNFGLSMMFLRRAGIDVTAAERQRLHAAFVASFVMLLAAFNQEGRSDPLVLSLGLPAAAATAIEAGACALFVGAGAAALVPMMRRTPLRLLAAPLTLFSTQALWFVVPVAAAWVWPLSAPATRYSSGMLAVMHSAQYLWVTGYFARRDAEGDGAGGAWSGWRYAATLVIGGLALYLPVPWVASLGWHVDFTTSVLIVAAVVNLHHFMVDGVVWKLRDRRVGQVLVGGSEAAARPPSPGSTSPVRAITGRSRGLVWAWSAAAVVLVALAAVDQWRHLLAVSRADAGSLTTATRLNPHDSPAFLRLAQAAGTSGDTAAAEAALQQSLAANPGNRGAAERLLQLLVEHGRFSEAESQAAAMLARWPDDAETLVNAGVLAHRRGDAAAAETAWRQALERQPALHRVHLYLAELIDADGRTADALPHYRRYLEAVAARAVDPPPDPREVVAVVIKFADALAHEGQADAAREQYALAVRMAGQTGLTDLAAVAEEKGKRF
ncbi:MAG: tetratricopeptide repeat protein [Vicinamibacterales bacterium]